MRTGWVRIGCSVAFVAAMTGGAQPSAGAVTSPVTPTCTSARALAFLKATDEAREAYAVLVAQNPRLRCARVGLTAIADPPVKDKTAEEVADLCARGAVYAANGRGEDAQKAYDAALEKDSGAYCAVKGVSRSWPSKAADWIVDALPRILLLLGALMLAGFLLLLFGYWRPMARFYLWLWPVRHLMRPRVSLSGIDDSCLGDKKVGVAMVGRIREQLQRFRDEANEVERGVGYKLDVGSSEQVLADDVARDGHLRSAINKLGEASDQTALIAAVLNVLFAALPIKRLSVAGVIEPAQGTVPSATLTLNSGSRLAGSVVLEDTSCPAEPKAGDYMRLCDSAAVWVQYQVARELRHGRSDPHEAESYAYMQSGLELLKADRTYEAIAAFDAAIELQPDNWAAHTSLAAAYLRVQHDRRALLLRIRLVRQRMRQQLPAWKTSP